MAKILRHYCNWEEDMKPQTSQMYTHTYIYILLYTNTYIFIDKITLPEILVYIMRYTCKLYTMYLRVLKIYGMDRPSEHPWNSFPIFPWFIIPFPNRHPTLTCFSNKYLISPTYENNHLSNPMLFSHLLIQYHSHAPKSSLKAHVNRGDYHELQNFQDHRFPACINLTRRALFLFNIDFCAHICLW